MLQFVAQSPQIGNRVQIVGCEGDAHPLECAKNGCIVEMRCIPLSTELLQPHLEYQFKGMKETFAAEAELWCLAYPISVCVKGVNPPRLRPFGRRIEAWCEAGVGLAPGSVPTAC